MGNRAVIAFKDGDTPKDMCPAIYLHWNGGRDSVQAFLTVAQKLGLGHSPDYDAARLAQIIGNWFGGSTSLGVGCYGRMDTDNYDNGVYWVQNWEIVEREFQHHPEQNEYDHDELVAEIIAASRHVYPEKKDAKRA